MMVCKHYFGIIYMKDTQSIFKRGDENHCKYQHKWILHVFIGNKEYDFTLWKKTTDKNPYAGH